jgi:Ca2+-binding RTX toxin-like protein
MTSSPLIDRGLVCSSGGIADPDAAGRHRLVGRTVDLGAFERGATAPTGIVFVGGSGPDTPLTTDGDDIFCGYGGSHGLEGFSGDDYVDGGSGADYVAGGTGEDRIFGGPGNDRICARDGTGGDFLDGGPGTDGFCANAGDARVSVEFPQPCLN